MPDHTGLFAGRAARLRSLAPSSPIGGYLLLLAVISDAQQTLLADATFLAQVALPAERTHLQAGMPALPASGDIRPGHWHQALDTICAVVQAAPGLPEPVGVLASRLALAEPVWRDAQADALLGATTRVDVDPAAAPLLQAALQATWVGMGRGLNAQMLQPMADAPGLCPLCGTAPVASIVHVKAPYQAYRYLHCALCACEWHRVRVHCTICNASGKDIAYHSLERLDAGDDAQADAAAVRAETCEHCHGYRKIMYVEKDPLVDPVADDLGTLTLDLLLGERGYQRASTNPLLWQPASQ